MKVHFLALSAALLLTVAPACAQKTISKKQWKKTTRIVYSRENGSVLDPYKEAFTVTADKDSISLHVYLGRQYAGSVTGDSSPEMFAQLKAQLEAQKLGSIPESKVGIMPTGGDFERLSCFADGKEDPFYHTYLTGGVGTMTIEGDPASAFSELMPIELIVQEFRQQKQKEMREREEQQRPKARLLVGKSQWEATTLAVYSFTDASLPPEYHRSYTIRACKDSISIDVTSYGEPLLHQSWPFTQERFNEMKQALAAQVVSLGDPENKPMPTGGTTDALALYLNGDEKPFFSASSYAGIGTLYVEKGTPGDAFAKALPESLDAILERTRQ
ncbi:MAG: hypothetical protein IJ692_00140 [Alloprevotella sp.]|nr:hypothetical protein [Alloprevotella sp.]MBR1594914.1 hypothetical protein [Alloprevotella sp.]MBR1651782.1 hypothetical protein [Alloprevotella sp.]